MKHKIGVWIDHKKAVIVWASADGVTARTLESEVGSHSRYSGAHGSSSEEGGGEKNYEERYNQHLGKYYAEVIKQIGESKALLIFGPGEAKLQLEERLGRSKTLSDCVISIETTDKLTDPQIVAKVKEHYEIQLGS
jgi:hypothetical protein